jgi:hypothetical protein
MILANRRRRDGYEPDRADDRFDRRVDGDVFDGDVFDTDEFAVHDFRVTDDDPDGVDRSF